MREGVLHLSARQAVIALSGSIPLCPVGPSFELEISYL
jgi:hypothetical protein